MSRQATTLWLGALFLSTASILLTYAVYTQTYYPALLMDEWGTLGFFFDKGFWPSIVCQHNNHIAVVPNAVGRLLSIATDADPFVRGLTTLLSATLLGALVGYLSLRAAAKGYPGSRLVRASRFTVALAFTLWLVCYSQLFWGMAIYGYFPVLFGFAAVLTLDIILRNQEKVGAWLLLPALLATASTLSFSYGVATWGGFAIVLFFHRKPWRWIASTLAVGLALIMSFRLSLPHCRPLSSLAPDISNVDPLGLLHGLVSLLGSAWAHSLAPLTPPSSFLASVLGALGLGVLCWLTFSAWKTSGVHAYRMLVTGCWLAAGMLLLVALGRNPASFAIADQMIAPRFMHLSIFFWTCLLAACSCRPGTLHTHAGSLWGAIHAALSCYLLITALLTVNWMSSMRANEMHFTSIEIKVEVIRSWVAPESVDNARTSNTLGVLDLPKFSDNVGKLRSLKWDFYKAFPSTEFPATVVDLPHETTTPITAPTVLHINAAKKTRGGTWTLDGSLSDAFPSRVRHLYFARGDKAIGYGVPAPYPAFRNKPRQPLTGLAELPARLSAAVGRLGQLLRDEQHWIGVSKSNPGLGEWRCEQRSEEIVLCRAAEEDNGKG